MYVDLSKIIVQTHDGDHTGYQHDINRFHVIYLCFKIDELEYVLPLLSALRFVLVRNL